MEDMCAKSKSPISQIMENLAKDLVELELQKTDSKILELVTQTYQKIYSDLAKIQRGD